MKKQWKWTLALSIILIADSFLTIHNGVEMSPMILWVMGFFGLSLKTTMYLRLLYLIPLVYIVHRWNYVKVVTLAYVGIYTVSSIFMCLLEGGVII
jgi:hypothetical protein